MTKRWWSNRDDEIRCPATVTPRRANQGERVVYQCSMLEGHNLEYGHHAGWFDNGRENYTIIWHASSMNLAAASGD